MFRPIYFQENLKQRTITYVRRGGLFATLPPVSYATEEEIRSQIVQKDMSLLGATQQKPDETLLSLINIWIINYIEQH